MSVTERDPIPCRIDAEQSVLGALLLDSSALVRISDWLTADDFYRRDHQVLYGAIVDLAAGNKPVDAVTLGDWIEAQASDMDAGYAFELTSQTPSAANIVAYAEIVVEYSRRRQLLAIGWELSSAVQAPGMSSSDIVAQAQHKLSGLGFERVTGLQPVKAAVKEWFADISARYESQEKYSGRLTPYAGLNDLTLGLKPADLIVLAGRPGMGKSVAGFGLGAFDALRGGRPAIFSLEMSRAQMIEREISALGDIPHEWLRNPEKEAKDEHGERMSDTYWSRASTAARDLTASGMLVDDTPSLTIQQIAARAKRAHLQAPLTMVVIDHLHIVKIKGGDNVVNQLGDVSRGAKALAKELRCPVVLLAQLNRGNTTRTDKRPTMADLRGSGEIEQDADYILLLHREDYYDENSYARGLVEMIVGKARHAKARVLHLFNRLDHMRFEDWQGELPKPPEKATPTVRKSPWKKGKSPEFYP